MITSSIFVRVVQADKDRGFTVLVGYDAKIVQRTAIQQISLSIPTQAGLDQIFERVKTNYSCTEVRDVTEPGMKKRLEKAFKQFAGE